MALKDWFEWKQIPQDLLVDGLFNGGMKGLKTLLNSWGEKAGQKAGEHIIKAIEAKRVELFVYSMELEAHDRIAANNLRDWWQLIQEQRPRTYGRHEPYVYGDENRVSSILTTIYVALDGDPQKRQQRVETFCMLGRMTDEQRDAKLEMIHNDTLMQWLRRADQEFGAAVRDVRIFLESRGIREDSAAANAIITIGMTVVGVLLAAFAIVALIN